MSVKFVRLQRICEIFDVSRSTTLRNVDRRLLTRPVKLSQNCCGWPESEINEIAAAVLAGASIEDRKALVARLHAERGSYKAAA